MRSNELYQRLFNFSLRIIRLVEAMPATIASKAIARQIVRSGTSVSANYRAACRAKSGKDFVNKLKMVEEELDETQHWLNTIVCAKLMPGEKLQDLG